MNKKGQVLIRSKVFPYSEAAGGGAENLMRNIASALSETGWKVDILSPFPETNTTTVPDGITCHYFEYPNPSSTSTRLLNSVRGARTFRQLARSNSYDVLVDDVSHLPFYPAHFFCSDKTTNSLFLHTGFFNKGRQVEGLVKGTVVEFIERTLPFLNSPEIICAGPSTERQVRTHTGHQRTSVLRPCIDIDKFEYEFDPDSKTILSLGRLTHRKNVSCLLRGWEQVEQTFPTYELVIAGSGPREQHLHELATELELENVTFAGFVSEEEKRRLYRDALLFALPSLLEGYVTTGLEALATGTPVIGSDTPGINDYVSPGENGYLFPTNEPEALASTIEQALANKENLEAMAERGRALAEDHDYDQFRSNADELFGKLAGDRQKQ